MDVERRGHGVPILPKQERPERHRWHVGCHEFFGGRREKKRVQEKRICNFLDVLDLVSSSKFVVEPIRKISKETDSTLI